MKHQKVFLTAEWRNIIMLNYQIDPAMLERFVPTGTTPDTFEGKTWLSLVGFEFNQSRVFGFRIPFHQTFEEVNLRFYVKGPSGRGVVFIREFAPKAAVVTLARVAFGENYSRASMSHRVERRADGEIATAEYRWGSGSDLCSMQIETEETAFLPAEGSHGQFISEHYWGYSAQRDGGCLEYEVQHARWQLHGAKRATFSGNATRLYGREFAQVLMRAPDFAFLAKGSPVTVSQGRRIQ